MSETNLRQIRLLVRPNKFIFFCTTNNIVLLHGKENSQKKFEPMLLVMTDDNKTQMTRTRCSKTSNCSKHMT